MGITDQGLEFLLSARRGGVDFDRTMTIGRQFLLVPPSRLDELLAGIDGRSPAADLVGSRGPSRSPELQGRTPFAEPLLQVLGANQVSSLDGSDFEGATHVHDLNTPLPPALAGRFSVVLDGGCLEHVFDFPTAIRSCMQMVSVGGHLLCMTPVSNAAGHGFYQFSPELYFRLLSPENGFEVERMLLAEVRPGATWYRVADPAVAGRRIEFTTRHQAYLYVQARRVDDRPPLLVPPVQSDYQGMWEQEQEPGSRPEAQETAQRGAGAVVERLRAVARRQPVIHVPVRRARRAVARYRRWRQPLDPDLFEPLGPSL